MRRKLPETTLSNAELYGVLRRTLPGLYHSAPGLISLLGALVVLQGLIPAVTVFLGKWTIDGVNRVTQGGEGNLVLLAVAWAGAALVGQLMGVASTVLQGYAADHFTVQTITALMRKMQDLPGLDVVEDPEFHDDVEMLQMGARNRPLNLVATILGLLRSVVAVVGVAGALFLIPDRLVGSSGGDPGHPAAGAGADQVPRGGLEPGGSAHAGVP